MPGLFDVLRWKFPDAKASPTTSGDFLLEDHGEGVFIRNWNEQKLGPKPDAATIEKWTADYNSR